jgi:hypothetical protein
MKIGKFYRNAVTAGIAADLRGREEIEGLLAEAAKDFRKTEDAEKKYFDQDRLFNPYADSRLLYGDPEADIGRILAGIDIDGGELHLAHTLNKDAAGPKIGLVLGHHPMGTALYQMFDVMHIQARLLALHGVTIGVAEQLMDKRIEEVERRLLPDDGPSPGARLAAHVPSHGCGQLRYEISHGPVRRRKTGPIERPGQIVAGHPRV